MQKLSTGFVALALLAGCGSPSSQGGGPSASPAAAALTDAQRTLAAGASTASGTVQVEGVGDHPAPNGKDRLLTLSTSATLYITGWAWDEKAKRPCAAVAVVSDGHVYPAHYGYARPDVATYFAAPRLSPTGYIAAVPGSALGTHAHSIAVVCVPDDGVGATRSAFPLVVTVR